MSAHTDGRLYTVENRSIAYLLNHDIKERSSIDSGDVIAADISPSDARRLAACWNAFEGVDTGKIEGKSVAEYVCGEAYLTGMEPTGEGMSIGLSGIACQLLADSFAGQFKGSGATNFLEVWMKHDELGPFSVTIQRMSGETPAQQKSAALRDLAATRALIPELLDALKYARRMVNASECDIAFIDAAIAKATGKP